MKIIMVSGWKGSGKDLAAEHLIRTHGFERVAFADPLKDMVAEEFDIPRSHCDDRVYKETAILKYPVEPKDAFSRMIAENMFKEFRAEGKGWVPTGYRYEGDKLFGLISGEFHQLYQTPRSLCILKGSTNRAVVSSYWIAKAARIMMQNPDGLFVISDARYRSEINQVKSLVGKKNVLTVRVNRFDTTSSTDSSERDLDNYEFDVAISNRGTVEEYLASVSLLMAKGLRPSL
jgi:hypothetical protein